MRTPEEIAREISIKIWGEWNQDHEYGEKSRRELMKGQHNAKIFSTKELISEAIKKDREESAKRIGELEEISNTYQEQVEEARSCEDKLYSLVEKLRELIRKKDEALDCLLCDSRELFNRYNWQEELKQGYKGIDVAQLRRFDAYKQALSLKEESEGK